MVVATTIPGAKHPGGFAGTLGKGIVSLPSPQRRSIRSAADSVITLLAPASQSPAHSGRLIKAVCIALTKALR